jgi:hypothetical protein
MSRVQKIIHVEDEDWKAMPEGSRSEIIRKFMRDYNNTLKGNLNDINIEILKVQIITLENQKIKIDTELQSKKNIVEQAIKAQEELRVNKLEEDKKKIEEAKKCLNCGKILEEGMRSHNFPKGLVCHSCFMGVDSKKVKEWD